MSQTKKPQSRSLCGSFMYNDIQRMQPKQPHIFDVIKISCPVLFVNHFFMPQFFLLTDFQHGSHLVVHPPIGGQDLF